MKELTRRTLLGAVPPLLGSVLIGCDDEKTGGGTPAPTGAAEPQASGDTQPATTPSGKEHTIAWSVWTGWMPFKLMEQQGFLDKRAAANGVKVKLREFKGYMDSVQAFAAKKVDGVAMTSMESLQPASNGVESVGILVNDVSNGGDGVLVRKGMKLEDLKGKTVLLEEFSVSHYLLNRALESVGLKEADVKIKNIPGDEAGKAFLTDDSVTAVATWNPHLFQATEQGKGTVVFSSRDIPGEIIDFLVVGAEPMRSSPKLAKTLVDAWYDAMAFITDTNTRSEAIEIMAKGAGASVQEFNKMLADTELYTARDKCASFLDSDTVKATMEKVKKFSFDHGLIKDASFTIGFGSGAKDLLRFDASHVREK
jgi:NitT/TauT family transport system substrate-binding protein